jgi:hypothetical protein
MMSNDDEIEDENLDEEDQSKKDAALSSALRRIMHQSNSSYTGLSKHEKTKKDWISIGSSNGLEFYLGSICYEVMHKMPKTHKGKVMFWDECIRIFKNEKHLETYQLEYVGGFREDVTAAVNRLSLQYA